MADITKTREEERRLPTETTPLSPQASQLPLNYNATDSTPSHRDADDSDSSDDSGGGYVSGSGRRESTFETSTRIPAQSSASQNISPAPGTPRMGALTWAIGSSAGVENRRAGSPSAYSPRMKPSLVDGAGPVAEGSPVVSAADATIRRRSSKGLRSPRSVSRPSKSDLRRASAATDPSQEEDSWAWLRNVADKYGAIELDNKGSVARDHLALERTFLAWLRTSLAFASIGIAITQLFRLNSTLRAGNPDAPVDTSPVLRLRSVGKPLGTTFLGVAIMILFIGWRRYFESQYWIIRGKFPASRGSVFIVTAVAAALIVISLVVVVVVGQVA